MFEHLFAVRPSQRCRSTLILVQGLAAWPNGQEHANSTIGELGDHGDSCSHINY